jgi:N-acyl-D-amino-acid deacylase
MAAGGVELIRGIADAVDGGAKRLRQKADGIRATIVTGQVLLRDDEPTGNLPGKLVRRGARH